MKGQVDTAALTQQGYLTEGDKRVPVTAATVRDWNAMKLAVWRSKVGWDIVRREAQSLVERAVHADGCPGKADESEGCLPTCPDREPRLSALVVLNATRQFAPVDARKIADAPYIAPSRERYSEVLAELAVCQQQLAAVAAGGDLPSPPPNEERPK